MTTENPEWRLLTPRTPEGPRLQLRLAPVDHAKIGRGGPWAAVVTDLKSGTQYAVRGAACGLPHCFCDAEAIPLDRLWFHEDWLGEILAGAAEGGRLKVYRAPDHLRLADGDTTIVYWDAAELAEDPQLEPSIVDLAGLYDIAPQPDPVR